MTSGTLQTWNVIAFATSVGSTYSTEANERWAVHTDGFQAQNESTIRIREEISKRNGRDSTFQNEDPFSGEAV